MAHLSHPRLLGDIYFTILAGNGGRSVFVDDDDRQALNHLVARILSKCHAMIHAYRWDEHALLMVLQVCDVSVPGVIQRVAAQHARLVNRKLRRKGYLFRHPHRSMLLEDPISFLEAVRYTHLYPNGSTADPLENRWSSHRAYMGMESISWLTTRTVVDLLRSGSDETQSMSYSEFMDTESTFRHAPSVSVNHPRIYAERADQDFFAWLKTRVAERGRPVSLDQLIEAFARQFKVDSEAIASRSRSPLLSLARALVAWYAAQNHIASLAEVARRFDRGRSSLHETRETYRRRLPGLFNIPLSEILDGRGVAVADAFASIGFSSERQVPDQ
jgi:putative transposase